MRSLPPSGVKVHYRSLERGRGSDLALVRIDEEGHTDACVDQLRNDRSERRRVAFRVEAAFGGHFLASFWNETDGLRPAPLGDRVHFLGGSHPRLIGAETEACKRSRSAPRGACGPPAGGG